MALVEQQTVADHADYLNCTSYDSIEIEIDGPEFAFLNTLTVCSQNCLLIRVAVAILKSVTDFLRSAKESGSANIYAMVRVTDWQHFGQERSYDVDGYNDRLTVGIWSGNFANPILRS